MKNTNLPVWMFELEDLQTRNHSAGVDEGFEGVCEMFVIEMLK